MAAKISKAVEPVVEKKTRVRRTERQRAADGLAQAMSSFERNLKSYAKYARLSADAKDRFSKAIFDLEYYSRHPMLAPEDRPNMEETMDRVNESLGDLADEFGFVEVDDDGYMVEDDEYEDEEPMDPEVEAVLAETFPDDDAPKHDRI